MVDHDGDDADETRRVVHVPHREASDDRDDAVNFGHICSWINYHPMVSRVSETRSVTTEKLKELILSDRITVPVSLAQVTVCGLPQHHDLPFDLDLPMLVQKFIVDQLGKTPEESEKHRGFTSMELAAFKTKQNTWRWERFSKRNGYLPCFVSALEHANINECVMEFESHYHKQYVFDCQPIDDCFHDVYRLLSLLYKDKSAAARNMIEELRDGARIALVNVWVITYSRSIFHFLNVLKGYLRSNFPILLVNHPWDQEIDQCIEAPNEPLLQQYTRLQYLLQFTHLARSAGSPQESSYNLCRVAAVFQDSDGVHTTATERKQFAAKLQASFEMGATKFGATDMLYYPPSILDPDDPDRNKEFKLIVENIIEARKMPSSNLPLSWIFFRSAFFKTGQLYIHTRELRKYAELCNIIGNDFNKFLCEFTACGSIIHIPNIPVFCDYVILDPTNFFYKLNELFYPRFDGDLKYGIVTLSTLKIMFGGDHVFFSNVLTSCTFAAEIDSSRIEYAGAEKGFAISEKCLFFPTIRAGKLEEEYIRPLTSSLFLLHDQKLQPTNITVNVVQYLIENESSITHLASQCLTLTQFRFNSTTRAFRFNSHTRAYEEAASTPKDKPVLLSIISHGDKDEIRIEGDQKGRTHIKKLIIMAYFVGIKKYRERYRSLFYQSNPITQFALTCLKDERTMHKFGGNHSQQVCSHCGNIPEFKASWQLWREIISGEFGEYVTPPFL